MWSLPWFPPALYRSPFLRTSLACHPRYSPKPPSLHSSVSVSQPIAMALHTLFRLTTIRSLSASSPGIVLVPCVHGRFYEWQRRGAAELSFLFQQSSRYSRRHYRHQPPALYRHGRPQQLVRVRLQGFLLLACSQPVLTLEGERSTSGSVSLLWQQVIVYAVQSSSVVFGLAEAQVAVALIIIVVFITFLLFIQTLRRPRERSGSYCIVLYHSVFIQYSVKVSSIHFLSVAAALVFHLKYLCISSFTDPNSIRQFQISGVTGSSLSTFTGS
jgi:hypothetical protein